MGLSILESSPGVLSWFSWSSLQSFLRVLHQSSLPGFSPGVLYQRFLLESSLGALSRSSLLLPVLQAFQSLSSPSFAFGLPSLYPYPEAF